MKTKIKIAVTLILLAACIFIAVLTINLQNKNIPNVIMLQSESLCNITLAEQQHTAAFCIKQCLAQNSFNLKNVKADIYFTNAQLFNNTNIKFLSGSAFAANANQNLAVLSEDAAMQLFDSVNITGQKIYINEQSYKICGVMQNKKDILSKASQNLYADIYVYDKNAPQADFILLPGNNGEFSQKLVANFNQKVKLNNTYNVIDLRAEKESVVLFFKLPLIFAFLILANLEIFKCIKSAVVRFSGDKIKKSIINLIVSISFIAVVLLTLYFIVSAFKIKYQPLPADNLFDFTFYFNNILQKICFLNTSQFLPDYLRTIFLYNCLAFVNGLVLFFTVIYLFAILNKCKAMLLKQTIKQ